MMYLMCIQVYLILHDVPRSYYFQGFQEEPELFYHTQGVGGSKTQTQRLRRLH